MRSLVFAILLVIMLPLVAAADVIPGPGPLPPYNPRPRSRPPRTTYVEQETDWNGLMGAGVFVVIISLIAYDDRRRRGGGDIEL